MFFILYLSPRTYYNITFSRKLLNIHIILSVKHIKQINYSILLKHAFSPHESIQYLHSSRYVCKTHFISLTFHPDMFMETESLNPANYLANMSDESAICKSWDIDIKRYNQCSHSRPHAHTVYLIRKRSAEFFTSCEIL